MASDELKLTISEEEANMLLLEEPDHLEESQSVSTESATEIDTESSSPRQATRIGINRRISAAAGRQIYLAQGKNLCKLCNFIGEGRILKAHIHQHFTRYFCPCDQSTGEKSEAITHVLRLRKRGDVQHSCYDNL